MVRQPWSSQSAISSPEGFESTHSTSDDVDAVAELALMTVTPEVEPAVRGGTAAEDLGAGVMDRERDPGPGEIPDHLLTERS